MYAGYPGWNNQFQQIGPWPQQQQFPYQLVPPMQNLAMPYQQHQPAVSGGSLSSNGAQSGQAGTSKSKRKQKAKQAPAAGTSQVQNMKPIDESIPFQVDPKFIGAICYNCGLPGHFVGMCVVPKVCFSCKTPGHHMDACPTWYKPYPAAHYWGSACSGLGFFHVDTGDVGDSEWLNIGNVGLVPV